ncbi:MAG: type II secretion system GspH family protein [Clostridiales Family XIII bacterium]|jgi:prepilin-type N-terminal cleavage/methylation domain-containing protein|nr:type II secretion system GspH family protein [Clostridiales Family XIII bacterium]
MNRKKGFTLVELIVVMVIALIIIGLSSGYLISSMNLFGRVTDKELDAEIADAAISFIADELQFASAVEPVADLIDTATANTIIYIAEKDTGLPTSGNGYLWFRRAGDPGSAINIFGSNFYHGKTIGIQYEVNLVDGDNKAVTVTVDVYDARGNKSLSRSKSVRLLNAAETLEPRTTATAVNVSILKIDRPTS